MHPIVFEIPDAVPFLGGEPITSFGIFMFFAFLTGGYALRAELGRVGYDPDKAWDLIFVAVIGGIVGAKLYFVFLNYPRLFEVGISYVFSRGGMVWYGGFLLATAFVIWEIRRSKLPLGRMADLIAPPLAIGYAVGRIGCLMVGDDYGRPTSLPWGMRFPEGTPVSSVSNLESYFGIQVDPALVEQYGQIVPVHPTQIYEIALSTLMFAILLKLRPHGHTWGWLFMAWLAMAGMERFIVEVFRAKDDRFFGFLTLAQLISLSLILVGIMGLARLRAPTPGRSDEGASPSA